MPEKSLRLLKLTVRCAFYAGGVVGSHCFSSDAVTVTGMLLLNVACFFFWYDSSVDLTRFLDALDLDNIPF